ncbi:cardiolipin synthase [Aggregicoccus sp. 17bor-14]|uniref:phospholipase D-like domain-containing protein n=1 Tax=Myxococcaceae TaxID=31 RepID=UPI00129D0957|nr:MULTISPECIES: phospholipase D-like domain-containing protein [Myxococcaceae]MBF5040962.1 PLDc N-terminal domain-containing protein [Simulacricoccus sp. 17bor-14]MRI86750.1 cardiolipin synthase [Aggregicoccus sp. 17bor-14]
MSLPPVLTELWPHVLAGLTVLSSLLSSGHAVLHKRDSRAAVGWVGLIWLVPLVGALLYVLLGVNRIRRRGKTLGLGRGTLAHPPPVCACAPEHLARSVPAAAHLAPLARLAGAVVRRPLLPGNRMTPLDGGDAAYGAMLQAIEEAQQSISLCTYIFDNDAMGRRFVDALARAQARGVQVRILIDSVGMRYSWPSIAWKLRRARLRHGLFLRSLLSFRIAFLNLRNHRKILVVDGRVGFTGGMNIRASFTTQPGRPPRGRDLHFRMEGPVVAHLQESFAEDWAFTTREVLEGEAWFPQLGAVGPMLARGISDGPDEDFETLRTLLLGALACARESVRIVTPYFLPDAALNTALNVAALRGVRVEIVLPEKGNLPVVQWASRAQLWQVLEPGCRVFLSPPPFDHTKLMVVDSTWGLVGSANWDPRSLRLNFEFNVELYDPAFARELDAMVDARLRAARPLTLAEVDARSLPAKLRDGLARLLSPYL